MRVRERDDASRGRTASPGLLGVTAALVLLWCWPSTGAAQQAREIRLAATADSAVASEAEPKPPTRIDPLLRRSDLPYAVAFFGSLVLVEPLQGLDRELHGLADGNERGADHLLFTAGDWAGDLWVDLGAAALTFGVGELVGSSRVARLGLRSLESLAAVDLLATLFKVGVGRQRPELSVEPDVFRPIAWSHDFASFPSGHTAHAFALATTASLELGGWTPWLAYPLAAGVGASRVVGGEHWATDIVAGAALGVFTARLTNRLHGGESRSGERTGPAVTALPLPGPGLQLGATLPVR